AVEEGRPHRLPPLRPLRRAQRLHVLRSPEHPGEGVLDHPGAEDPRGARQRDPGREGGIEERVDPRAHDLDPLEARRTRGEPARSGEERGGKAPRVEDVHLLDVGDRLGRGGGDANADATAGRADQARIGLCLVRVIHQDGHGPLGRHGPQYNTRVRQERNLSAAGAAPRGGGSRWRPPEFYRGSLTPAPTARRAASSTAAAPAGAPPRGGGSPAPSGPPAARALLPPPASAGGVWGAPRW